MSDETRPKGKDEKEINPVGTLILMLLLAAFLFGGWAYMYWGMFTAHGPVS